MVMKIKIFVASVCFLFVSGSYAQEVLPEVREQPVRKKHRVQVSAGPNLTASWLTGFNNSINSNYRNAREKLDDPRIGMGINLQLNYFLTPVVFVSFTPQVASYGARFKYYETVFHELGVSENNRIITENLTYFHVPIVFNYYIVPDIFSINGGGYAAARVSALRKDPKGTATQYDPDYYRYESNDISSNYRIADLGLVAGATVELGRFKIVASYIHGILDVSDIINRPHSNRSVNLALLFRLSRR
jgi:hypothetical protein